MAYTSSPFASPYPLQAEPVTATYSWTELSSGTGFITLYPTYLDDGTGILTQIPIVASNRGITGETNLTTASATLSDNTTLTFEWTPFSKKATLYGEALFEYPISREGTLGTSILTINLYKNSDLIVSKSLTTNDNNSAKYMHEQITIPKTDFRKGDVLKLTLVYTGTQTFVYLVYDPSNTVTTALGMTYFPDRADMKLNLPFSIK